MTLFFSGISSSDTITYVSDTVLLHALAWGENLKYLWNSSSGKIIGEGENVKFVSETAGEVDVNCSVTDTLNTIVSKNLKLVFKFFLFKSLIAEKDVINIYDKIYIKANVYGNQLTYYWTSEGVIIGEGAEVMFTICHAGRFKISCTINDSNGNTETKIVNITVNE